MPGVVSAEVSCTTGKAVCTVKEGTDVAVLVAAIESAGFSASATN